MSEPNWANQTIWTGDNLEIMRGMNSGSVDLIYLDPPFNSNKDYAAPIGSEAAGAAFKDTWTLDDVDLAWHGEIAESAPALYAIIDVAGLSHGKPMKAYLIMMAVRLLEMRRLLKPSGSIYLHCDQTAGHYLKMLMDAIFDQQHFINQIAWNYGTPSGGRASGKKPVKTHDILLVYAREYGRHVYNRQYTPYSEKYIKNWFRHVDEDGRKYQTRSRKGVIIRQYLDESPGVPLSNTWTDIMQLYGSAGWFKKMGTDERTGYPTQKPLALLERIIRASSNEGGMVLDPFCGCATACVAAENLGRQWVGIDISPKAADLVKTRLKGELGLFYRGAHRTDIPQRSDLGELPHYRTHKHTLFGRQEGLCAGCRTLFPFRNLTVDHVVAQSRGGNDHIDNLQLLCGACNSSKGTGTQEALIAKLRAQGIRT